MTVANGEGIHYSMAKNDRASAQDEQNLSLEAQVEALLFVAPGMVSLRQLSQALETTPRKVEQAIKTLEEDYEARGFRILRHKGELRLTSAPEAAQLVERFVDLAATAPLSASAQPLARASMSSIGIAIMRQTGIFSSASSFR